MTFPPVSFASVSVRTSKRLESYRSMTLWPENSLFRGLLKGRQNSDLPVNNLSHPEPCIVSSCQEYSTGLALGLPESCDLLTLYGMLIGFSPVSRGLGAKNRANPSGSDESDASPVRDHARERKEGIQANPLESMRNIEIYKREERGTPC